MVTAKTSRQYAERGNAKRVTVSLVLPPHQIKYLRRTAERTSRSISSVASELFDEAMFGGPQRPTE